MMEELKENITLNSLSDEELYEEGDSSEESASVSSKRYYARWLKPVSINELKFVSKDVLLMHVGKSLIFYDLNTQKEDILVLGNKFIPGSDDLHLEGIACVGCCSTDLLALAEQPPVSKVVICLYPELKVLTTLSDSSYAPAYKSVLFLNLEYLIGLRDYPSFDLVVWAWRIGEKLLVVDTGFIQPKQYLNLSENTATGRNDVYLSQTELDVRCKLQFWTFSLDCKTVYVERTRVELPLDASGPGCWTPCGWYVFCDSSANVYRVRPNSREPEMVVRMVEPVSEKPVSGLDIRGPKPMVCSSKQGFVMYVANQENRLTYFKEDTKGVFKQMWNIVVDYTLLCIIVSVKNEIYAWSDDEGALVQLTHKTQKMLKVYGSHIKLFTFIKPMDDTVATINDKNMLYMWDASTGDFKCKTKLNGTATDMCSNPFYPYIAITFENGKMELLRTVSEGNKIERIAKIVLCDEQLSSVKFFSDGNICSVAGFPTGRFFYISITLGQSCSVLREYHLGKHVVDNDIIDNNKSSFLAVLYTNIINAENAGNLVLVFDINFHIVFQLKDVHNYYTTVLKWSSCSIPDALNIAFTIMLSKCILLMTINIVKEQLLESQTIPINHQLRSIMTSRSENHCITFSPDGSYNIYEFDDDGQWKRMVMVTCSRWQVGGLIGAQADANAQKIVTLSHQRNLMCTSFKGIFNRTSRIDKTNLPIIEDNFETQGIGFEDSPESPKRMTWKMISEKNELIASKVIYSNVKKQIIQDFERIKSELQNLLENNINGPEEMKLDIEEFDLNVDYRISFRKKCEDERKEYEEQILSDINKFKMETENIIKEKWETLFIKPKSIYCLKKVYKVDNYPISKIDEEIIEKANKIIEERRSEFDDKQSYDLLMMGSISYELVDIIDTLNSQYNYYRLEIAEDEIILLKFVINKLKHTFNQLFDDLFIEKHRQLDSLKEYNDRLRVIESELTLACKIESTEPPPVDYEWNKYEQTEELLYVSDDEVLVKLHANNATLPAYSEKLTDVNLGTEEKNGDSATHNFRQQALIKMMDGVLEKRWEDELKKDVPKPQCILLNKNPVDYTADDLKTIGEYEKLTFALNDERLKYKNILEEEKIRIHHHIARIIEQFDNNVFTLFQTRLKYNSAINQEDLKILRLSKMLTDSYHRKQKIKQHSEIIMNLKDTITETEQIIAETHKKIAKTEPSSLVNTIETLNHKINVLDKRFQSDFRSKKALIAYNRRPKILDNENYSSLLGYQFVNTIMDPTDDNLPLLTSEFVKYLDMLRKYDDYKYVDEYNLNMDKETWYKICNLRRKKIETEFKISICQKDVTEKDNLLDSFKHAKEFKEDMIEKLKMSIVQLENHDMDYEDNPEVQLVVKLGDVETILTGHFSDFQNTTLISSSIIDEVNDEIKEMGNMKIEALINLLKFKSKCRFLKWEYEILNNHKIPLYTFRFNFIKSMKITENMINFLKFNLKGINIAEQAAQHEDKELEAIKFTFTKQKEKLNERLNEMYKMVRDTKNKTKSVDEDIGNMTLELSKLQFSIDSSLNDKLMRYTGNKVKDIMKITHINSKVIELHKEIKELHIQLELHLLRAFPTLYTNFPKKISTNK